jgi:sec-independent protein translocase protein TatA
MIGNIGLPELIIIFLIVLFLFGAGKIPKIARDIGGGIREFKKSITGENDRNNDGNDNQNSGSGRPS